MNDRNFDNPYKDVDISILTTCKEFSDFKSFCKSLAKTCSSPHSVEILIKIDSHEECHKYQSLLEKYGFRYKILVFPYYGRLSIYHIHNDLYAVSSGKIIWPIGSDFRILHGDWYRCLTRTLNTYKDNIHYAYVNMDLDKKTGKRGISGAPAITREWCNVLGKVSLLPNVDRWLYVIAKDINRIINIPEKDLYIHYPPGRRVMTRKERETIFYPKIKKSVRKFKKHIRRIEKKIERRSKK